MRYTVYGCRNDTLIMLGYDNLFRALRAVKHSSDCGYKARLFDNRIQKFVRVR